MEYNSTLEQLLEEDKVVFLASTDQEKPVNCLSANHEDDERSMTIDITNGTYWCRGCGIEGDALAYLRHIRGMEKQDALKKLQILGWKQERIDVSQDRSAVQEDKQGGLPKHVDEPFAKLSKNSLSTARYEYLDANGNLICLVVAYSSKTQTKKISFTPSSRGGYWVCGPLKSSLPDEDRKIEKYPLYNLPALLAADASKQVWVLDDEKCVDYISKVPNSSPCVTVFSKATKSSNADFSPLAGRRVLLIASTAAGSRDYMQTLGAVLNRIGCAVRYVLPKGDGGHSIADSLVRDGPGGVVRWIKDVGVEDHSQAPQAQAIMPPLADTDYFIVLGVIEDRVVFQLKKTYQLRTVKQSNLINDGTLISLAPQTFWLEQCDEKGFTKNARLGIADSIIRAAEDKGIFDTSSSLFGRGAAAIDSKIVFNTGDGVVIEDENKLLSKKVGFDSFKTEIFIPGGIIRLEDDKKADVYLRDMYKALMGYRWLDEIHGRAFIGWVIASIIGGALPFRPMVWLLGPASSGKTFLLEKVLQQFLGNMLKAISDTSEAGLANAMDKDSLPVYIDEFEPGSGTFAAEKWKSILKLIRQATSGGGQRVRANVGSGSPSTVTSHQPRFSILLASVDRPKLSDADSSRFFWSRLSREPVSNWPNVQFRIGNALTRDKCLAMRTHVVRHASELVDRVHELELIIAEKLPGKPTREYQIMAALTAGAEFCSGDGTFVSRLEGDYQSADVSELGGLKHLLDSIPATITRGEKMTLFECLRCSTYGYYDKDRDDYARSNRDVDMGLVAQRHGLKIIYKDFNRCGVRLCIDPKNSQLLKLFNNTVYENMDLHEYFLNIDGARMPTSPKGRPEKIKMAGGLKEYIEIKAEVLNELGFTPKDNPHPKNVRSTGDQENYAHNQSDWYQGDPEDATDDKII